MNLSHDDVGDPPAWMSEPQRKAWRNFVAELPRLRTHDRARLELACVLRSRLSDGDLAAAAMVLLHDIISALRAADAEAAHAASLRGF